MCIYIYIMYVCIYIYMHTYTLLLVLVYHILLLLLMHVGSFGRLDMRRLYLTCRERWRQSPEHRVGGRSRQANRPSFDHVVHA